MAWTNIHKLHMFQGWFNGSGTPNDFYFAFATSAVTPTADTSAVSQLTIAPSGNGWAGSAVYDNTAALFTMTSSLAEDWVQSNVSALSISAVGGDIPITGDPLRWLLLCGTPGGSALTYVYAFWSLGGNTTIPDTQVFNITNGALRATNA